MAFPVSLAGSVFQTYGGSRLRLYSPLSGASGGVWVYVGSQRELLWASIHTGGGDSRISGHCLPWACKVLLVPMGSAVLKKGTKGH